MTAPAIELHGLTRRYRGAVALDDVTVSFRRDAITGLLGRNGAGKTTLMSLVTAQDRPSAGSVRVDGHDPFERAETIERMRFVRDNQRYPDDYKLKHAIAAARIFSPNWSQETADRLIELFRLPTKPIVKKFSRGQLSSLGIVLGLASRAPITFFDEPYLGLDATARHIFYDELLADYAAHPRTIILSTHLIDEMERLLERVVILDRGRVVRDADVDDLRGTAYQVSGRAGAVEEFVRDRATLSRRTLGGLATAVVAEAPDASARSRAEEAGLDVGAVSLQDLVAAYGLGDGASGGDPEPAPQRPASRGAASARAGRSAS